MDPNIPSTSKDYRERFILELPRVENLSFECDTSELSEQLQIIIDSVSQVVESIEEYSVDVSFNAVVKIEYDARMCAYDLQCGIKNNGWDIVDGYKLASYQFYQLIYIGIGIRRKAPKKKAYLRGFKKMYYVTSYHGMGASFDKFDAFELLNNYVLLLRKLEKEEPYCILSYLPALKRSFNDNLYLIYMGNDQFSNKIHSVIKLTHEIENLITPVVALTDANICNLELDAFLASHYRIALYDSVKIMISLPWMSCFMIAGILRRLSCLCAPILPLNIVGQRFNSCSSSKELLSLGVIDSYYEREQTAILTYSQLANFALMEALKVDLRAIRIKKAGLAEKRFYGMKSNSSFWDKKLKEIMEGKDLCGRIICEKSVSYLKKVIAEKKKDADEYEVKLAVEQRNQPETRAILDAQYASCLVYFYSYTIKTMPVVAIIGFDLFDFMTLFGAVGFTMSYFSTFTPLFEYDVLTIKRANGSLLYSLCCQLVKSITVFETLDLVLITQVVRGFHNIHEMIKTIEGLIPANTIICLGSALEDLRSIQRQARYPERIFGLHFWSFNRQICVANLIIIDAALQSRAYISKLRTMLRMDGFVCIETTISTEISHGLPFERTLLSILSEISRQIKREKLNSYDEVQNAIQNAGLCGNILIIADIFGFDKLLKYAKLLEKENAKHGITWNFNDLKRLMDQDLKRGEIFSELFNDLNARNHPLLYSIPTPTTKNFIERTISSTSPTCTRILLSSLIEPIRWYNGNVFNLKIEDIHMMNQSLLGVFCFPDLPVGPFRFIDDYLPLYKDFINKSGKEYQLLKEKIHPNIRKIFGNTPITRKL